MSRHPLETYLTHLYEIHQTGGGTPGESFYGAFETLVNHVGARLKPKVRCVPQLKNTGAGEPDFGLYTASQFERVQDDQPAGTLPERGVIEVKGWGDDTLVTTRAEQVSKYWRKYGLVLVTNYRDFVLVGRDDQGKPVRLEAYRLAESKKGFLGLMAQPPARYASGRAPDRSGRPGLVPGFLRPRGSRPCRTGRRPACPRRSQEGA